DVDHIVPYESDGPTEPDNLAALCRRHHRAKTFRAWDYAQVTPGTFLWHGPQGRTYLVTGAGTFPASPGPSATVGPPPGLSRPGPPAPTAGGRIRMPRRGAPCAKTTRAPAYLRHDPMSERNLGNSPRRRKCLPHAPTARTRVPAAHTHTSEHTPSYQPHRTNH